jgi:hypothetical protein
MPFRERRLSIRFNTPTQFLKLTRRHPTETVRRLSPMRWGLIRKLKLRLRQVKRFLAGEPVFITAKITNTSSSLCSIVGT